MRHLQDASWGNDIVSVECAKLSEWMPRAASAVTRGSIRASCPEGTVWELAISLSGDCVLIRMASPDSGYPRPQDVCTALGWEHQEELSLAFPTVHRHGMWLGDQRKVFKKIKQSEKKKYLTLWTMSNPGTTLEW